MDIHHHHHYSDSRGRHCKPDDQPVDGFDAVLALLTQQHTATLEILGDIMTAFADVPAAVQAMQEKLSAADARIEAKLSENTGSVDLSPLQSAVDATDALVPPPAEQASVDAPVVDENPVL